MPRHPPNALFTLESNHPCAGTSPPLTDTQIIYSRKIITLPAPPDIPITWKKPETLGIPTARRAKPVCSGVYVKPTEVIKNLFTISKIMPARLSHTGISYERPKPSGAADPPKTWWRRTESNRRPSACKADALPTELRPPVCPTRVMVGLGRLELPTSRLSSARSNQLSYRPDKY